MSERCPLEVCQSAAGSSDSDKEGLPDSRIDSEEDGLPERHGLGAVDAVVDDQGEAPSCCCRKPCVESKEQGRQTEIDRQLASQTEMDRQPASQTEMDRLRWIDS